MTDRRHDLAALFPGLDTTVAPPTAYPWVAETHSPTPSGAVPITDQHGNVVGWATDIAGHTTETTPPEGRDPAAIARNATLLAMAPHMAAVLRLIATSAPCLLTLLDTRGIDAPAGMRTALRAAMGIKERLGP